MKMRCSRVCGSPSLSCASVGRQKYLERGMRKLIETVTKLNSPVYNRRLRSGNCNGQACQVAPVLDNRDGGVVDVKAGELLPVWEVVRHPGHLSPSPPHHLPSSHKADANGQAGHSQQGPHDEWEWPKLGRVLGSTVAEWRRARVGLCLLPTRTGLTLGELVLLATACPLKPACMWVNTDPRSQVR